jgi:hypothetical protein
MKYRCSLAFALFVASLSASAHNVLPGVDWCVNGKAIEIGDIAFGGDDTKSYKQCLIRNAVQPQPFCRLTYHVVSSKPCPRGICGEFDDDYRGARQLAQNYCDGLDAVTDPNSPYFGFETVPIFTGPDSLTNSAAHHLTYDVDDGVYGACMVCVGTEAR